jgi:flagellar biosynthesis GTPase FlhF
LTQADLEYRLGKIWEGVRGTNLPLAFISTGKNVPGDICEGTGFPFARLLFKEYRPSKPQKVITEVLA